MTYRDAARELAPEERAEREEEAERLRRRDRVLGILDAFERAGKDVAELREQVKAIDRDPDSLGELLEHARAGHPAAVAIARYLGARLEERRK